MTKKRMRLAVAAGIAVLTMAASSVSALADHAYSFNLPALHQSNYIRYSTSYGAGGFRPYVTQTTYSTPRTYYYIAPSGSSTAASSNTSTTVSGTYYMTYKSGYGGTGQNYRLAGYPTQTEAHSSYTVSGRFRF